jgi:metal-sulfur cluster biosynthetic enzyme
MFGMFGKKPAPKTPAAAVDEASVREALRAVQDPEIGMNIVDLGLIYAVAVAPQRIDVRMTMTSPACPMSQLVLDDVRAALTRLTPGRNIDIDLVWEPPWTAAMMSPHAKQHFGWTPDDGEG